MNLVSSPSIRKQYFVGITRGWSFILSWSELICWASEGSSMQMIVAKTEIFKLSSHRKKSLEVAGTISEILVITRRKSHAFGSEKSWQVHDSHINTVSFNIAWIKKCNLFCLFPEKRKYKGSYLSQENEGYSPWFFHFVWSPV